MHTSDDDTPRRRVVAWFQATPFELVGLAVLLTGALAASLVLWWQATSRPSELPSASLRSGPASGQPELHGGDTTGADPGDRETSADVATVEPDGSGPHTSGPDPSVPGAGAPGTGGGPGAGGDPSGPAVGDTAGADPAASAAGDEGRPLLVHVTGAVERPGLVELDAGARVGDAVRAAGGLTPDADPDLINLARPLADGEHVRVPREGDDPVPEHVPPTAPGEQGSGGATGPGAAAAPLIDLNHASAEQLQTLPGIGPARADAIVQHREAHGPFAVPGDLRAVSGIGEATFQRLADLVTVG